MERCPKCNAELPEVAVYCPLCGTNLGAVGSQGTEPGGEAATPPAPPDAPIPPATSAAPPAWRVPPVSGVQMLGPAAMAGIAAGFLVGVPALNNFCCLWTLGCGPLAVFFFHKQFNRSVLPNEAAKLGLLSGFFGFIVAMIVSFVAQALIYRSAGGLVQYLREELEMAVNTLHMARTQEMLDAANGPGGWFLLLFSYATRTLLGFLAMSTLGALLAGALARRREM